MEIIGAQVTGPVNCHEIGIVVHICLYLERSVAASPFLHADGEKVVQKGGGIVPDILLQIGIRPVIIVGVKDRRIIRLTVGCHGGSGGPGGNRK